MTVGEAIRAAATRLAATSDTARLDAEWLMAHALGLSRSVMLLTAMRDSEPDSFAALVARRAQHEPVAYITGTAEFYGLTLTVTPDTLIPRADSETLIAAALEQVGEQGCAIDLGTGSGALLLALLAERPRWDGVGIDASAGALKVASRNAAALGMGARSIWHQRDWRQSGWADDLGTFDLVLCNPPYVEAGAALDAQVREYEPGSALFSGPEGLDDYRIVLPQLRGLMTLQAISVLEIGANQAGCVTALAQEAGFAATLRCDLAGRPRTLILN